MFGIGAGEFIVILIVGLIVFGPSTAIRDTYFPNTSISM